MTKVVLTMSRAELILLSTLVANKMWRLQSSIKAIDRLGQDPQPLRDTFESYRDIKFTIDDAVYAVEKEEALRASAGGAAK